LCWISVFFRNGRGEVAVIPQLPYSQRTEHYVFHLIKFLHDILNFLSASKPLLVLNDLLSRYIFLDVFFPVRKLVGFVLSIRLFKALRFTNFGVLDVITNSVFTTIKNSYRTIFPYSRDGFDFTVYYQFICDVSPFAHLCHLLDMISPLYYFHPFFVPDNYVVFTSSFFSDAAPRDLPLVDIDDISFNLSRIMFPRTMSCTSVKRFHNDAQESGVVSEYLVSISNYLNLRNYLDCFGELTIENVHASIVESDKFSHQQINDELQNVTLEYDGPGFSESDKEKQQKTHTYYNNFTGVNGLSVFVLINKIFGICLSTDVTMYAITLFRPFILISSVNTIFAEYLIWSYDSLKLRLQNASLKRFIPFYSMHLTPSVIDAIVYSYLSFNYRDLLFKCLYSYRPPVSVGNYVNVVDQMLIKNKVGDDYCAYSPLLLNTVSRTKEAYMMTYNIATPTLDLDAIHSVLRKPTSVGYPCSEFVSSKSAAIPHVDERLIVDLISEAAKNGSGELFTLGTRSQVKKLFEVENSTHPFDRADDHNNKSVRAILIPSLPHFIVSVSLLYAVCSQIKLINSQGHTTSQIGYSMFNGGATVLARHLCRIPGTVFGTDVEKWDKNLPNSLLMHGLDVLLSLCDFSEFHADLSSDVCVAAAKNVFLSMVNGTVLLPNGELISTSSQMKSGSYLTSIMNGIIHDIIKNHVANYIVTCRPTVNYRDMVYLAFKCNVSSSYDCVRMLLKDYTYGDDNLSRVSKFLISNIGDIKFFEIIKRVYGEFGLNIRYLDSNEPDVYHGGNYLSRSNYFIRCYHEDGSSRVECVRVTDTKNIIAQILFPERPSHNLGHQIAILASTIRSQLIKEWFNPQTRQILLNLESIIYNESVLNRVLLEGYTWLMQEINRAGSIVSPINDAPTMCDMLLLHTGIPYVTCEEVVVNTHGTVDYSACHNSMIEFIRFTRSNINNEDLFTVIPKFNH